ncbi:DNA sulfur modification protein DndD [Lysinibacillus fusiformis]|uniref:DNA sulfur modification protein DndD n=1 Tax=Lysinibacillus fusiformis TaxID=28031 RepID=UPI003D02FD4A
MILKKIIFKNYKTYYGIQEIDLTIPESNKNQKKNIILIGGLNGTGKTTFLKAILYILFGKRGITTSSDPKEIEKEYKKLFSNVINNTFFEEGGNECSISLTLETDTGAEWVISVKWYVNNLKTTGHEIREIAIKETPTSPPKKAQIENIDTYNKFIDRIIPFFAAPFFIFDGEEIRQLIEKQNTQEMKNAIQKISGMKSNTELISDLNNLKDRLLKEISKSSNSAKVTDIQKKFDEVSAKLEHTKKRADEGAKKIQLLYAQQKDLQKQRQEKLLNNSKSRETISKKIGQIEEQLKIKQKELTDYFKTNMIHILLSNKIPALKTRILNEKKYREQKATQATILQPYENFMQKLLEVQISPALTSEQINHLKVAGESIWFEKNPTQKAPVPYLEELHDLNNSDLTYFSNLTTSSVKPILTITNTIDRLNIELEEIMLQLQNAPEATDTQEEEREIENLTNLIGQEQLRQTNRTRTINRLTDDKRALETKLTKNKTVGGNVDQFYAEMQYLDRTIKAIIKYEEEYTQHKAMIIKTEFENMLKKLFRKQDEFGKIEFDTESYTIRLYNDKMQEISIQDRSAGEMQMISSSLIWALTRASNLNLPVVIDTPLGRLDSKHRTHLIEHYYRHLSDQVIILSTDTEITQEYIDIMSQSSSKQYLLDYDQTKKYTIIRDGYFEFIKDVNKIG